MGKVEGKAYFHIVKSKTDNRNLIVAVLMFHGVTKISQIQMKTFFNLYEIINNRRFPF